MFSVYGIWCISPLTDVSNSYSTDPSLVPEGLEPLGSKRKRDHSGTTPVAVSIVNLVVATAPLTRMTGPTPMNLLRRRLMYDCNSVQLFQWFIVATRRFPLSYHLVTSPIRRAGLLLRFILRGLLLLLSYCFSLYGGNVVYYYFEQWYHSAARWWREWGQLGK